MDPMTIAAGASAASAFLGFKGNQASARAPQQTAEYNAKVRENEAGLLQRAASKCQAVHTLLWLTVTLLWSVMR